MLKVVLTFACAAFGNMSATEMILSRNHYGELSIQYVQLPNTLSLFLKFSFSPWLGYTAVKTAGAKGH